MGASAPIIVTMAAKSESKSWKKLKGRLPSGHIMRVENPALPGTPDVNLCINGVEFWCELKHVHELPKQAETPVFRGCLKPEQILWHRLRHRAKGKSYIVGYVEESDEFYIIPGEYAPEFNTFPMARLKELNLRLEDLWAS